MLSKDWRTIAMDETSGNHNPTCGARDRDPPFGLQQAVGAEDRYDINTVINRSVELLAHQALFHDVEFVLELDPDIPWMTGDPSQFQQVFTNLVINAGTAMHGKGKITITSRFDPASDQVVLQFWDTVRNQADIGQALRSFRPPMHREGTGLDSPWYCSSATRWQHRGTNSLRGVLYDHIPLEGLKKQSVLVKMQTY